MNIHLIYAILMLLSKNQKIEVKNGEVEESTLNNFSFDTTKTKILEYSGRKLDLSNVNITKDFDYLILELSGKNNDCICGVFSDKDGKENTLMIEIK